MIGDIFDKKSNVSAYQPPKDVKDLTELAAKAYMRGNNILTRPAVELNNYSVIDRTSKDQRTFNSLVDESNENPDEAWKWKGTRSLARNKTMAMHAQLTSQFIVPAISAQNDAQQEDQDVSDGMHTLVEWMTVNSNYRPAFLLSTQGMLVNPVTYLEADYGEVYQTIKEKDPLGDTYSTKEIIDEVLSGFQSNVLSADQVLITNEYEQNIQRQYIVIKRKYIEYGEAHSRYHDHANWLYVQAGQKSVFNPEDGLFYDVYDEDHPDLLEEVTLMSRKDDLEVCFLGGIYMGDDNVEWNAMRHRDNRNAPKYNFVPFGYERTGEHYFFFKSLINRVGWDDQLIDAMWQVHMNRFFLDAEPPVAISGADKVDTSVMFPGGQLSNADPQFKITPIMPARTGNPTNDIKMVEDSISQASAISESTEGQLPPSNQKAYTVGVAQRNAAIILEGVSKTLAESIRQYGELMVNIALQHLTVPEVDELNNLKYKNFILENQTINGRKVSKELRFDEALIGRSMNGEDRKKYRMKLLTEAGYPDHKKEIYVINPALWSKMKYLCRMETDMMTPTTRDYKQQVMARMYALLRQDPLVDPEVLVRKLLHEFFRNDAEELMSKNPQSVMGGAQGAAGGIAAATAAQTTKNISKEFAMPGV